MDRTDLGGMTKMGKKKTTEESTHHMGKHTGYSLIDGVYHIAPSYVTAFGETAILRSGVDEMLASVTRHAAITLSQITKSRKRIWDDIIDDLGLDPTIVWEYSQDETIHEKQEED